MRRLLRYAARLTSVVSLAVVAGCDAPTDVISFPVRLSLPTSVYTPGQTVQVTVENQTFRTWYASTGCNIGIERLVDDVWTSVYGVLCVAAAVEPTGSLTAQLWAAYSEIEPLGSEVLMWSLPADAEPGLHRVRLTLHRDQDALGEPVVVISPVFSVSEVVGAVR